ncbi:MAG: ATP-binding protein [Candidatus Eremiobacteraeota bacterium]|nr:ATP-binding protein [Candidatus Eremiobacteraeota bacterium]
MRAFLARSADGDSDLDAAELIVGELVANVVRHAPGPIGIYCSWRGEHATLVIADRGPGIPRVRPVPAPESESGRGLLIVEALARACVVEHATPYGSRVVVELPVRRGT